MLKYSAFASQFCDNSKIMDGCNLKSMQDSLLEYVVINFPDVFEDFAQKCLFSNFAISK